MADLQDSTLDPVIRIAVRTLAETVHRSGGLAGPLYGGVSAIDGMRLHQRFVKQLADRHADCDVQSEVYLNQIVLQDEWQLQIGGRCDALVELPDGPCLIEAKSFMGSPDLLPAQGEPVHWAQAKLYGALYLSGHPELGQLRLELAYLPQEGGDLFEIARLFSREELAAFLERTCRIYADFAGHQIKSRNARLASGISCTFPYEKLRAGQKRFMQEVVGAARQKGVAFIQAPTGTGKTMAALFPAVKAAANRLVDHIFYLTAMTSTRHVAARAMADMRQRGLRMRDIVLYAKEKLCLCPEQYCDSRNCPYAVAYYDNRPAALRQLFLLESIDQREILDSAKIHRVCPFELSLDMSLYCEIIICDYNYAFDPRVRLVRFFGEEPQTHLLLVDEAHNLPARSREMFSAAIDSAQLAAAQAQVKGRSAALDRCFERLQAYFDQLVKALVTPEPALDQVEAAIRPAAVMVAEQFRASRELPATLLNLLARFGFLCRQYLDSLRNQTAPRPLLDFYFAALFFSRVAEEFHDKTYVTVARLADDNLEILQMCLDSSEKLAATYQDQHPAVFFSATLSPIAYYIGLLNGWNRGAAPESLLLGTPFPPENLQVLVCSRLSTRYKMRRDTCSAILDMIFAAVRQRVGNYLVFVPSFAYLEMLRGLMRVRIQELAGLDVMFQGRTMNEAQRRKFLRRFEDFGAKTLLAVAVIGGVFAEGIDLAGERLTGVVVVGVGLPQICPEREIMRQYYGEALGSGYEFAYLYPGFNKVQQAAGRVIRSEEDRGFVLLIDDRYDTPVYRELFPAEWQPKSVETAADLAGQLQTFWNQTDPG